MYDASSRKLLKIRTSAAIFSNPLPRRSPRLALTLALVLQGCASVTDILPPALNLPNRATDVTVVQHAGNLVIGFQIPKTTTEGMLVRHIPTIDLRIGAAPGDLNDVKSWLEHATELRATGRHVETPAAPWVGRKVAVSLRLLNDRGHDAGWSPLAAIDVTPPLAAVKDLVASSQPAGISLKWTSTANRFRVFRRDSAAAAFEQIATVDRPAYDDQVDFGKEFSYYIQAIAAVEGSTAESEDSPIVSFTAKDDFAPAIPSGLTFILGGKSIELAWTHNTEPDLAGYRVYRSFENNALERISETRDATSYSDRNIESGKRYRYAVTAIDRSGNESKMSPPISVLAP